VEGFRARTASPRRRPSPRDDLHRPSVCLQRMRRKRNENIPDTKPRRASPPIGARLGASEKTRPGQRVSAALASPRVPLQTSRARARDPHARDVDEHGPPPRSCLRPPLSRLRVLRLRPRARRRHLRRVASPSSLPGERRRPRVARALLQARARSRAGRSHRPARRRRRARRLPRRRGRARDHPRRVRRARARARARPAQPHLRAARPPKAERARRVDGRQGDVVRRTLRPRPRRHEHLHGIVRIRPGPRQPLHQRVVRRSPSPARRTAVR